MRTGYFPFGTYTGLEGKPTPYVGRVVGLVLVAFSPRVTITLPELKLVETRDPLLLMGTDMMRSLNNGGWRFLNVGYHPRTN